MKKLTFGNLINMNGKKVLVKSYQESRFVKVGELNEMIVRVENSQENYTIHLKTEKDGGIFGIPEKCFDKNVNNGTWIDIFAIE